MKVYYTYAGITICIEGPDENMYKDDRNLKAYVSDAKDGCHHYIFNMVSDIDSPLGELISLSSAFRIYKHGNQMIRYFGSVLDDYRKAYMWVVDDGYKHDVFFKKSSDNLVIGTHIIHRAVAFEQLVNEADGIVMHASFIEHNGEAIIFTAPSGTGKSTQADLWVRYRDAEIINGDRCALRFIDGKLYACGVPFAGSSNISKNRTLPLKCIVCLGQSSVNTIEKLHGYKAFRYLWEGVGVNKWDKEHVEKVSSIVERVIASVPIYKLDCTPDIYAIEKLEECL